MDHRSEEMKHETERQTEKGERDPGVTTYALLDWVTTCYVAT